MNKKIILIIVSMLIALGLVGCGSKDTGTSFIPVVEKTEPSKEVYLNSLTDQLEAWTNSFNRFSSLLGDPSLGTDFWIAEVAFELVIMEKLIAESKELEPPSEFKPSHKAYLKAMSHYEIIPEQFPTAYDNRDSKLLNKIIEEMGKGDIELSKSMSLLPNQ